MDLPAQQSSFHQSKWQASSIWGRGSRYHLQDRFFAEWTAQLPEVVASKVTNSIVGMGFGWLVCVDWLLGERETLICKIQPTIKCREKQSLIFTLYLSEELQCIVIFTPSFAGISNLHSCFCLLTFSLYKHFLPFIPFFPDNGPLTMLWVAPTTLITVLPNLVGPVQIPSWKAWCFVCGVCPCSCDCWELQLFNRMVLKLLEYLGRKSFVGYQLPCVGG